KPVTLCTTGMLGVPPEQVHNLRGAAGQHPRGANRFANGFDNPADFDGYFYDPEDAADYLAEVTAAADSSSVGASSAE
ncbi:FAD-binding oxidoreductase, partial [Streptomyces yangpuensis]